VRNPALLLKEKQSGFSVDVACLSFPFWFFPTVNNVGVSHEIPADFVDTSPEELAKIINVNVTATLRITSLIAPAMTSRYVPFHHSPMAARCSHTGLSTKRV
jgi:hypothetical protein